MTPETRAAIVGGVVGAVVGAGSTFLLGLWQFKLTNPDPKITITITQAQQEPGEARVRQFVTVKNSGEVLAKAVNFTLRSVGARLERSQDGSITGLVVIFSPPRLQTPTPICGNGGDCDVIIGDLQPNTYATFKISYAAPALREDEIETYSDNAKTSKVVSSLSPQ